MAEPETLPDLWRRDAEQATKVRRARLVCDYLAVMTVALLGQVLSFTGQLFVFAMKIALPAVTAILIVNLAFGVMKLDGHAVR